MTGFPNIGCLSDPDRRNPQAEYESRERWWLFGILAMLGLGLMLVTLGSFGSKT